MARSTFYYHLKSSKKEDKYKEVKDMIHTIFHKHKGRYGYRRITLELRNRNRLINHKTVKNLMDELGLKSEVRKVKYRSYKGEVGKTAPNIIDRDFVDDRPYQKLATDVTQMTIGGCKIYLSPILDMCDGEILSSGMPRNDVLFVKDRNFINKIRTEIAAKYDFSSEDVIVLFAPTWRKGRLRSEQLDIAMVKRAVSSKVGKSVVVLGRGHHTESGILEKNVIDVSDFPDMQKLLIASDILITDYSSSMWDYSFTEKPCFLFTPDLEIYEKTPGFDRDIHSWGFPVCETNDQLESEICRFNQEDYLKRMKIHHASLGNYESGTACRQVCDYINKFANC